MDSTSAVTHARASPFAGEIQPSGAPFSSRSAQSGCCSNMPAGASCPAASTHTAGMIFRPRARAFFTKMPSASQSFTPAMGASVPGQYTPPDVVVV
ncbi:MAG: hypothetical protein BWX80_03488 [Candidatus Hydrogenedentes bacterium ADurb.Bin101]|nr:MAG: hypothetical protein BWX80_03488 [Candidatus Hydrogenedentes bacterium ADurb.Bin101]